MSYPAVLYDHNPTDIHNIDDIYFVSKMFRRISAPPAPRFQVFDGEESDNDCNKDDNQADDVKEENKSNDNDENDGNHFKDESESNADDDLCPMETIMECDSDYVLIPISTEKKTEMTTITTTTDDSFLVVIYRKTTRIRNHFRDLCNTIVPSSKPNLHSQIWDLWKAKLQITITKPISYYLRYLSSPSIYSSYDWVSETVIDRSGNRLILPGACVVLDSESKKKIIDDSNDNHTDHKQDDITTSENNPLPPSSSSPSSLWASTTIMVSAHDLLAVKRNNQQAKHRVDTNIPQPLSRYDAIEAEHRGGSQDYRYYYRYDDDDDDYRGNNIEDRQYTTIMVTTTKDATQQWTRALWKLVKRKINMWYCVGYLRYRLSIQSIGRLLIDSQQLLLKYNNKSNINSNNNNRILRRALMLLPNKKNDNGNRNHMVCDAHECEKMNEQEVSDFIFDPNRSRQNTSATTKYEDEGIVIIEMSSCKSNS
mmetsp:Transcript_7578/g.8823  ORF Transcript_7578/g.8823 Transcript_7578/m.8823 type:complete len:481 (-) Transcript_7578:133-1575(-)